MLVRKALLHDASNIYDLVNSLSGDGTLLKRPFAEICENIRDFTVADSDGGVFLGCGALHLYGPHLCEVRSIVVKPEAKGQGAGGRILNALIEEAEDARHPVRLPVHAHPRLLLQVRLPHRRRQIRAARQDLQRLPDAARACIAAMKSPWCAAAFRACPSSAPAKKRRNWSASPGRVLY